jgi:sugar O-acyltransferase (sialic acid O-acetyltransferase NeuD family)
MKNILIYGASGHAKMIVDIVQKTNYYKMKGYIDSFKTINQVVFGYSILGNLDHLPDLIDKFNIEGIVIAIGDNFTRKEVYHKIKTIAPDLEFVVIIHPSAIVASDVLIGEGSVIMANTVINAQAKIGRFCILNSSSILGHESIMADFSSLASRATLAGNVCIGVGSAVCLSSTIIQNISIGDNTVIGAGSLVLKDIGSNKTAYGAPVRVIKDRAPNTKYLGKKN